MLTNAQLLSLIAPVFLLVAIGWSARRLGWLAPEADGSLLKVVMNVLYPSLIFESVLGNPALNSPANLVFPPLVGFCAVSSGFGIGYLVGRSLGLAKGRGLRTFSFAIGIFNYGYIAIPLVQNIFGSRALGVLFVHNMGCEAAVWTVGILILAGGNLREGWRKLLNAPVISIVVALLINATGFGGRMPPVVLAVLHFLGGSAIPLGLLLIGATIEGCLAEPRKLANPRVMIGAVCLRLAALPALFLLAARFGPFSPELKQVMVIQAAMPAGVMPIVIARHYQGHPLTAVQVMAATTVVGLFTIPWWVRTGMWFVGVSLGS